MICFKKAKTTENIKFLFSMNRNSPIFLHESDLFRLALQTCPGNNRRSHLLLVFVRFHAKIALIDLFNNLNRFALSVDDLPFV